MRLSIFASVAIAAIGIQSAASGADLVAVVDLKFVKATDQPASLMCFGDRNEDCAVWATLNVYRARVRKVLMGAEPRRTFFVLFGKHALKEIDFRNVPVIMNKIEAKTGKDPQYQILDWAEELKVFCFPKREDDKSGFELKKDGEQPLTCYDAK